MSRFQKPLAMDEEVAAIYIDDKKFDKLVPENKTITSGKWGKPLVKLISTMFFVVVFGFVVLNPISPEFPLYIMGCFLLTIILIKDGYI